MNKQDKEKAKELASKYQFTDGSYIDSITQIYAAMEMAKWKEQQVKQEMMEKAVEYLIFNTHDYYDDDSEFAVCNWLKKDEFIEKFKQAIEEE